MADFNLASSESTADPASNEIIRDEAIAVQQRKLSNRDFLRMALISFIIFTFIDKKIDILIGKMSDLLPSSVKRAAFRVQYELTVVWHTSLSMAVIKLVEKLYAKLEAKVGAIRQWAVDHIPQFLHFVIFLARLYNQAVRGLVVAASWIPLVNVDFLCRLLDEKRIDRAD